VNELSVVEVPIFQIFLFVSTQATNGWECNRKTKIRPSLVTSSMPSYLLEREHVNVFKHSIKVSTLKRKEKFGKWVLPLPKVHSPVEEETFRVQSSGKRNKTWKRMVTKVTFISTSFTRTLPKN
jgi:ribosome biogenesis protein NSA2